MPASDDDAILAALRSLADAFNDHDLDRIIEHFADDAVLEMPRGPDPWGSRFTGKAAVRAGLAARFAGLPDVHYCGAVHAVAGDTGTSRWTVTGTTPDGRKVRANGCDFYTFRDGLVVKKDSYWKIVDG